MNKLKLFLLLSAGLITACAPPRPSVELVDAPKPPLTQKTQKVIVETQEKKYVTKNGKTTEVITTTKETVTSTDKNKAAIATSTAVPASWDLSGAIAARNKQKAWSASINWLQRGAGSYQIRLFGPLGSGTVMIEKQGGNVNFRDGPKSASSKNADSLLMQQTGVRLPVNNLYYWVRGVPAPGAVQSAKRDASNHMQVLRQGGYTIEYLGYSTFGKYVLPNQIRLQGNGVFIKLVIKRWKA